MELTRKPMHLFRVLTIAAVTAGGIGAVGFGTALPAAAAGCYDTGCNNKDATAQGCASDARDASTRDIYVGKTRIGTQRLRYSPTCNAYWSRWDPTGTHYYVQMSIWHPGNPSVVSGTGWAQFYGNMLGRSGGQVCYGSQVYDSWLNWVKWEYATCIN